MTDIDVQDEKLTRIELKVDKLITRLDEFFNPKDGAFIEVTKFQASCPRKYMKFIWLIILPIGLANITAAVALAVMMSKLGG